MTISAFGSRLGGVLTVAVVVAAVLVGGDHAALAEAAHDGGHAAGLPQFNASFFLTQLFWLGLIFGTFYILIQGVAVPTVVRVLESRDSKIAFDIGRAEELRNEAAAISMVIEDKIVHARDHARSILNLATREAESVANARLAMFDAKINSKVREAERRIASARENALKELPILVSELAQDVVVRLGDGAAVNSGVAQ